MTVINNGYFQAGEAKGEAKGENNVYFKYINKKKQKNVSNDTIVDNLIEDFGISVKAAQDYMDRFMRSK